MRLFPETGNAMKLLNVGGWSAASLKTGGPWQMIRITFTMLLMGAVLGPSSAQALSKRQVCLRDCGQMLAACASTCGTFGHTQRTCKIAVLKRCRCDGVQVCAQSGVTTTTLRLGTTSTTLTIPTTPTTTTTTTTTLIPGASEF